MELFKPTMYQKSIFDIPYEKLKQEGIHCLVFDLDNTIATVYDETCPEKTKELIMELKKDFIVALNSNNNKKRLKPYLEELQIEGVYWGLKPSVRGLWHIQRKYHLKKNEICMIGDQLVTDVLSGNRFHVKTILVDPLGKQDLKVTGLNRKIENRLIQKGLLERGKYYE